MSSIKSYSGWWAPWWPAGIKELLIDYSKTTADGYEMLSVPCALKQNVMAITVGAMSLTTKFCNQLNNPLSFPVMHPDVALLTLQENNAINASFRSIGDVEATALAGALANTTTLKTLYLWQNSIGDAGATALAGALATKPALTTLCLGQNDVGDAGAALLAVALTTNEALTTLNLYQNKTTLKTYRVDGVCGGAGNQHDAADS